MSMATQYDLVIVGGGLVGGSLACALRRTGIRIALVEAVSPGAKAQPSYDERVIALSQGSARIFQGIGIWPRIREQAEPIRKIHISDRGHCGFAHLDAREEGVEALGYVASARAIGQGIQEGLSGLDLFRPAQLLGLRIQPDWAHLEIVQAGESRMLTARLVVGADGGHSSLRRRMGFPYTERPYGQDALITRVTPSHPRAGVAYERFTDTGPLALLPMRGGSYSVVWTTRASETERLLNLDDADFLRHLQDRFGSRLGTLNRLGHRRAYPLVQRWVPDPTQHRLVLIGNAAHCLHPVAGQGLNLGLRDVAALAQVIADTARSGGDLGASKTLSAYRALRGRDPRIVAETTDLLVRLFMNPWAPVRLIRDVGLLGLDILPRLKSIFARQFMGLRAARPRLARGIPL